MNRFGLKIILVLLLMAVLPLAASVILVGQVVAVADRVAEGQVERLQRPLRKASRAYRALFRTQKRGFELAVARVSEDSALRAVVIDENREGVKNRLEQLLALAPIAQITLTHTSGWQANARNEAIDRSKVDQRQLTLKKPVGSAAELAVTFYTQQRWFEDFAELGRAQQTTSALKRLRPELSRTYRQAFFVLFAAIVSIAAIFGLWFARRTTRRITRLAAATERVRGGDLTTHVESLGKDELGHLALAFNAMVSQLRANQDRIAYLDRIGAWQDVARRLAHEIKNPLTPIKLAVQQVAEKYSGSDEDFARTLAQAREIITEEVEGLRRLVGEFSAFARLPEVQLEAVELAQIVEDFLRSHADLVQRLGRCTWKPPGSPIALRADRMLIKHALFNLVENAVQAVDDPTTLSVEIACQLTATPSAALTVTDDGPGMNENAQRNAFEPYHTTKEHGTGLGLAIVKKIILDHQGSVALSSAEGRGTRVTLELPLVSSPG